MVEEVGESQGVTAPDWEAVRQDYADRHFPVAALCTKHGITTKQLQAQRRFGDWPMRYNLTLSGRTQMIKRMYAQLDRQLLELERSAQVAGDKEVTLLANLAKTLEKLIDLDTKRPKRTRRKTSSPEMVEMRDTLITRLNSLEHK